MFHVAFQGEYGAFSHLAIQQLWGTEAIAVPCREFVDVLGAVARGEVDCGILPIENSTIGPIPGMADRLAQFPRLRAVDETGLVIHPCVLALPGVTLAALRRVSSHPAALQQCSIFLSRHPWITPVVAYDTAGAARAVAAAGDRSAGAVAGTEAAERYGLEVLAADIGDRPDNATRFVVMAR